MFEFVTIKRVPKIWIPTESGGKVLHEGTEEYQEFKEIFSKWEKDNYWEERACWRKKIQRRVNSMYSPKKAALIIGFFDVWDRYYDQEDFTECYRKLKWLVDKKVNYFVRRWSRWRLSYPDFESVLWEEAWKVVEAYNPYEKDEDCDSDFYLYEKIELALNRRGLDVARKATQTKKGYAWHSALPLPENFENIHPSRINVEKEVINKLFTEQLINDPALTNEERHFLKALYADPDASFQYLADVMGYSHREKARRTLKRIQKKLVRYKVSFN